MNTCLIDIIFVFHSAIIVLLFFTSKTNYRLLGYNILIILDEIHV